MSRRYQCRGRVFKVEPGRSRDSVDNLWKTRDETIRQGIEAVAMEMWQPFMTSTRVACETLQTTEHHPILMWKAGTNPQFLKPLKLTKSLVEHDSYEVVVSSFYEGIDGRFAD